MKIEVKKTSFVRPAAATPQSILLNSNIDHWAPNSYVVSVMFYRPTAISTEEAAAALKEALGRVLVPFYPMAGRAKLGLGGRNHIDCNSEGVMFVEAESDGTLNDFGDFSPSSETRSLVPPVDHSVDSSSLPLSLLQVTSFKCGGLSLGVANSHQIVDGVSGVHFINSWADMARGLDVKMLPHIDRTLLRAREPPQPRFEHIEYRPPPTLKLVQQNDNASPDQVVFSFLKITRHQLDLLKAKSKEDENTASYSSFVALAGHIWRCACKARNLPKDQKMNLYITIDGRSRLKPPLSPGFFGNAIFPIAASALSGDLDSKPVFYGASKIHNAIVRMDDEYLRSAIDYLELLPDLKASGWGVHYFKSPNLSITSWLTLPFYDADFGWGRPIFVGPAGGAPREGKCHVMRNPANDGSLFVSIAMPNEKVKLFERFFYDI